MPSPNPEKMLTVVQHRGGTFVEFRRDGRLWRIHGAKTKFIHKELTIQLSRIEDHIRREGLAGATLAQFLHGSEDSPP